MFVIIDLVVLCCVCGACIISNSWKSDKRRPNTHLLLFMDETIKYYFVFNLVYEISDWDEIAKIMLKIYAWLWDLGLWFRVVAVHRVCVCFNNGNSWANTEAEGRIFGGIITSCQWNNLFFPKGLYGWEHPFNAFAWNSNLIVDDDEWWVWFRNAFENAFQGVRQIWKGVVLASRWFTLVQCLTDSSENAGESLEKQFVNFVYSKYFRCNFVQKLSETSWANFQNFLQSQNIHYKFWSVFFFQ